MSGPLGESRNVPVRVEIVRKLADQVGLAVDAECRVVERFFVWINRNRRVARTEEPSPRPKPFFASLPQSFAVTLGLLMNRFKADLQCCMNGLGLMKRWASEEIAASRLHCFVETVLPSFCTTRPLVDSGSFRPSAEKDVRIVLS